MKISAIRRALVAVALLCFARAATAAPAEAPGSEQALSAVLRDTCAKQVVLLGEATHGDGATFEFKVRLIQRLVDECGFNAVFFEASHYDFLIFSRKIRLREDASPGMISAAIGRLWNQDKELAPLFPFLYSRARSGRVVLGGLDDQVSSAGALYSPDAMAAELTGQLTGERQAECRDALRRRTNGLPDSDADQALLRSCLAESRERVSASRALDSATRAEQLQMLASFDRVAARYPWHLASYIRGRDLSMYVNFRWLANRLPPRSKIIIWSATNHIARDASVTGEYMPGAGNLGFYVRQAYGRRAFALGFSGASGAFYYSRVEPARMVGPAGSGSLEAQAMAGSRLDTVYLGPARLQRVGVATGSLFQHKPLTARWSEIVDGVVIFREERPPRRLTP